MVQAQAQVLVHQEQVQELRVAVPVHLVTELDPARVQVLALAHLVQAHQAVGIQVQELLVVALVLVLAQVQVQVQELAQAQLTQAVAELVQELPEQELEHRVAVQVPVVAHLEAVPVAVAVQVVNYNNYSKTKNPVESTGFFLFYT